MRGFSLLFCDNQPEIEKRCTGIFQLVVQKSRREPAHAQNFQFKIPTKRARMRGFSSRFLDNQLENPCTEVCRLVVTNLRRKSAHAHTFGGDFELKIRACANSRRKFVPTNLQTSVHLFSGWLSQNSDENQRMRTF